MSKISCATNWKRLLQVTIPANDLKGGAISSFKGNETISPDIPPHKSLSRTCVELGKNEIYGSFNLERVADNAGNAIFRINGMWDIYADLPFEMIKCANLMETTGIFRVRLNDSIIFDGPLSFWNYRRWRFWPSIDIQFSPERLRSGDNTFSIANKTKRFAKLDPSANLADSYFTNVKYHVSDVQIVVMDAKAPEKVLDLPDDTFLGHIIGGHEIVQCENEDYSHAIDLFVNERQGNLIVFMMNPGKTGFDVDLDVIDTERIKRLGLKVALRYYGDNSHSTYSDDEYIAKLKRFVNRLGDAFIGFGPHEQHGSMAKIINENRDCDDISTFSKKYIDGFAARLARIREIREDSNIWDTDPSFYSHFHIKAGATMPAVELCVNNATLDIASARGTAKAFDMREWTAINSFECQAYGGLTMRDLEAAKDPLFERKRSNLWWLTQHMLYLGGARTIYSESGIFEHAVTLQKSFDDPHLVDLRKSHENLVDFAYEHSLTGQPIAEIAYLQGQYDICKTNRISSQILASMGNSCYSWKSLEVCYPDMESPIPFPYNDLTATTRDKINTISDTPYGQADIFPVDSCDAIPSQYKLLIMTGWHTMTEKLFEKLHSFVKNGGALVMLLPHFTTSTLKSECSSAINRTWLSKLCGVEITDETRLACAIGDLRMCEKAEGYSKTAKFISDTTANDQLEPSARFATRNLIVNDTNSAVVIENADNSIPFLISNKLGKGDVHLFNLANFPDYKMPYLLINEVIKDIANDTPFDVKLKSGKHINHVVYPSDEAESGELRVYAVNNDWFGNGDDQHAVFEILGKKIQLKIPPREVTTITTSR